MKQISLKAEHRKLLNAFLYSVKSITSFSQHVSRILLASDHSPMAYQAGQYIKVVHQVHDASPLSIACAPNNQAMLEFHLSHHADNERAQDILRMCHTEKELRLLGPFGNCTVQHLDLQNPIIFLGYGTGFAPIKAVIEEIARLKQHPMIYFYWMILKTEDLYLIELIGEWTAHFTKFIFKPIVAQRNSDQKLQQTLLHDHSDFASQQIYASGPRLAIQETYKVLATYGLTREKFFSDVFS